MNKNPIGSQPNRVDSGFTLTELLMSIGLIGTLLSLMAPALHMVKSRAGATQSLSRIRDVGMVLEFATEARAGVYPFAAPSDWLDTTPNASAPEGTFSTDDPWAPRYAWPALVHNVAPWPEHYEAWLSPGLDHAPNEPWTRQGGVMQWPSYAYANSFIAEPRLWTEGADPDALDQKSVVTAQRRSGVRSPSAKALAFDTDLAYLQETERADAPRAVLTADGAAALRHDDDARAPFPNPLRDNQAWLYHDTKNGLAGRDF